MSWCIMMQRSPTKSELKDELKNPKSSTSPPNWIPWEGAVCTEANEYLSLQQTTTANCRTLRAPVFGGEPFSRAMPLSVYDAVRWGAWTKFSSVLKEKVIPGLVDSRDRLLKLGRQIVQPPSSLCIDHLFPFQFSSIGINRRSSLPSSHTQQFISRFHCEARGWTEKGSSLVGFPQFPRRLEPECELDWILGASLLSEAFLSTLC